jgi:hypothetical protein
MIGITVIGLAYGSYIYPSPLWAIGNFVEAAIAWFLLVQVRRKHESVEAPDRTQELERQADRHEESSAHYL